MSRQLTQRLNSRYPARQVVLVVFLTFLAGAVNAQDMYQYYTVSHPDEFDIDWGSFYNRMNEHTARVRSEYPHYLDLAYGSDPKQRLDIYLPKGEVSNAPVFLFVHQDINVPCQGFHPI